MSESKKIPDFMSRGVEGEETYDSPGFLGRLFRDIKLPYVKWTDDGNLPSFEKNPFDSFPSRDHPGRLSAYEQAVQRLPDPRRHLPDFDTYKHAMNDKISRMRDEYYRHMNFCAHTFRVDDADSLNEEEIWLTMVGTPGRSPNRHEQGMRLTLYISNFLSQIREELSMYDPDQLDDEEEGRCIIGQAFGLWMFTLRDMEENLFGSYSLNLLAFEHIHRSIERFEEQMKLKEEAREAMAQEQSEPRTLDNLACRPELAFTD